MQFSGLDQQTRDVQEQHVKATAAHCEGFGRSCIK